MPAGTEDARPNTRPGRLKQGQRRGRPGRNARTVAPSGGSAAAGRRPAEEEGPLAPIARHRGGALELLPRLHQPAGAEQEIPLRRREGRVAAQGAGGLAPASLSVVVFTMTITRIGCLPGFQAGPLTFPPMRRTSGTGIDRPSKIFSQGAPCPTPAEPRHRHPGWRRHRGRIPGRGRAGPPPARNGPRRAAPRAARAPRPSRHGPPGGRPAR